MTFKNAISACACRPRARVWGLLAFVAAFGFVSALFAAEVTSTDAARAAKAWVDRGYAMGVFASERTVSGVDEIEDATTGARLHVVKFEGGGFAVLSADDLVDPVISFSATGDGVPTDDDNPFWTLLRGDIAAREAAAGVVRGAGSASGGRRAVSRARPASATSTASQRKWSALLGGGMRLQSVNGDGVSSLSDMRVAPLVQAKWGQEGVGGEPCFNYFTPNNGPCGCVATAGAEIMRYFQWPAVTMEMPPFTNPYCTISNAETVVQKNVSLTTQGGSYDWSNMPLNPAAMTLSPVERQAIGKLTSDIGICCGMRYFAGSASIGSYMLAEAFTNHFGYGSTLAAQWDAMVDQSGTEAFKRALLSNFDAGLPVVLSLEGVQYDHAVVSDGYGYSDGSLFIHLNFGWTGISDAWYSPPHLSTGDDDDFNYIAINGFVFNIFPDLPPSTVICSGRVLDKDGNPVAGAEVSYCPASGTSTTSGGATSGGATTGGATTGGATSGGTVGRVLSNAKGIYALKLPPGTYKVYTSYGGSATSGAASEALRYVTLYPNVATKTAYSNLYWPDPAPVINNRIEQDLVLSSLEGVAVPQFDPPPCLFYPSTNVFLTCATSGATIRYTLDGTEPTETSTVYTGPIAISDDVVITAKAWVDGMNPSASLSATYTYDASQGAPKGDYFADPILISGASGTRVVADNSAYTVETGEPLHTRWVDEAANSYYYYPQYNTIWYEWKASGSGQMTFKARLEGHYTLPPMIAVYTGDTLSSIERIAFDTDEDRDYVAVVAFDVQQGMTYRIVGMSGWEGEYGTFTLNWYGDLGAEPTVMPLEVTTSVLPPATSGVPYAVTLEATGGVAPYTWSVAGADGCDESRAASSSFSVVGTAMEWQEDDNSWELPLPFDFPFYGSVYSKVWVNSNGTLTFDGYFADYEPKSDILSQHPMIAVLWKDLRTTEGDIYVESSSAAVTIRWSGIYYNSTSVSFSATLYADGTIRLCYGDGNADGGMIGVSAGDWNNPNYILSSASESGSMDNAQDIVFTPKTALPSGLSLSSDGVLSGTPTVSGVEAVTLFVTDVAGTRTGRTFNLTVEQPDDPLGPDDPSEPVDPLKITTSVLPPATSGVPYEVTLEATGGVAPYVWSMPATVAPPPGLSLSSDGVLSGMPTVSGVEDVTVFVTDVMGAWSRQTFNLMVVDPVVVPEPVVQYSVRFNANGGTGDMGEQVIAVGETQNLNLCQFTRVGYAFAGWEAASPTGSVIYDDGAGVKDLATSEDIVNLYACWVANRYTVAFEANGGEGEVAAQGGVYDTAFSLPVNRFTWTGRTFKGWATAAGGDVVFADGATVSNLTAEANGRVTLYAVWAVNRYTLSFDSNGGSPVASITQDYGTTIAAPAAPTRTGYTFAGWSPPIPATMPAKDVRAVAQWTVNRYTVVFEANGGEGGVEAQGGVYGTAFFLPLNRFTRTGHTFKGWATSADGEVAFADGATVSNLTAVAGGNVTLYAKWAVNRYTLTFDVDGGSEVAPITQDYDTAVTAPAAPTRTGYTFEGWNPPIPRTMPANDMRIVAQWTANGLDVTFDANGGDVSERSRAVDRGEAVGELPAANRPGYILDGWFTAASGGTRVTETTTVWADVTYYAQWRADEAHIYINVENSYSPKENGEFLLELSDLVESYNAPKVAVKGLPTGLKFDTKTLKITGTATKPGTYTVKVSATSATVKKAVEKEFLLTVPNLVWDVNSVGIRLEDKYTLQAGIVPNTLAALSANGWTLALSGLPAGLKYDAKKGTMTGIATKAGIYTVTFTATNKDKKKEIATATFEVVFPTLTIDVAAYDDVSATNKVKVTGGGKYAFNSKVSFKATPDKGNVFAGWFDASGKPLVGADYRTASCAYLATDADVTLIALFAKESEDIASLKVTVTNATTAVDGKYELDLGACVNSLSIPKVSVKGLPTGLKFDTKTLKITGQATKPGVYTVTVEATNTSVKKATNDSKGVFTITVPNKICAAMPNLKSATDAYDVVLCGVAFDPNLVNCTPADGWTVKVAGLPTGLKYDAKTGLIAGVSTAKPGSYTVTFTATKGKEKQEATITLNVEALPNWVVGTFDGVTDNGTPVTLTVAANGKISVKKTLSDGKALSLAAASFDTVDGNGGFHAIVIGKSGKETITSEVVAYPSGLAATSSASGEELIPYGVVLGGDWTAWQNLWKRADTKADMPVVKKDIKFVYDLDEAGDTKNQLTFTFKKDGVVAFAGMVGGAKVSGSAQLILVGRDAPIAPPYQMTLYAPPKGTFTGWSATFGVVLGTDANHVVTSVTLTRVNPQD